MHRPADILTSLCLGSLAVLVILTDYGLCEKSSLSSAKSVNPMMRKLQPHTKNPYPFIVKNIPEYLRVGESYTATCKGRLERGKFLSWALKMKSAEIVKVFYANGSLYDASDTPSFNRTDGWLSVADDVFISKKDPHGNATIFYTVLEFKAIPELNGTLLMCFSTNALQLNISAKHENKAESVLLKIYYPMLKAEGKMLTTRYIKLGETWKGRCSAYIGTFGALIWEINTAKNHIQMVVGQNGPKYLDKYSPIFNISNTIITDDLHKGRFVSVDVLMPARENWWDYRVLCFTFDMRSATDGPFANDTYVVLSGKVDNRAKRIGYLKDDYDDDDSSPLSKKPGNDGHSVPYLVMVGGTVAVFSMIAYFIYNTVVHKGSRGGNSHTPSGGEPGIQDDISTQPERKAGKMSLTSDGIGSPDGNVSEAV